MKSKPGNSYKTDMNKPTQAASNIDPPQKYSQSKPPKVCVFGWIASSVGSTHGVGAENIWTLFMLR